MGKQTGWEAVARTLDFILDEMGSHWKVLS